MGEWLNINEFAESIGVSRQKVTSLATRHMSGDRRRLSGDPAFRVEEKAGKYRIKPDTHTNERKGYFWWEWPTHIEVYLDRVDTVVAQFHFHDMGKEAAREQAASLVTELQAMEAPQ